MSDISAGKSPTLEQALTAEQAIVAGEAVLRGYGTGTYEEACEAIRLLIAAVQAPAVDRADVAAPAIPVDTHDDDRRWSWWAGAGSSPENYTINEDTREAIIAAGRVEFEGELFTIVCATQDGPFACTPFDDESLVERVVERFADDNADRFGEDGFDGDIDQHALASAMNAAFAAFMGQHGQSIGGWSFTGQRDREKIRP